MRNLALALALSLALGVTIGLAGSDLAAEGSATPTWMEAFRAGRLDAAGSELGRLLDEGRGGSEALHRAGELALWENRLDRATEHLTLALESDPENPELLVELAEAAYRRHELSEASALLVRAGREAQARQLAAAARSRPYRVSGPELSEVEFVQTSPLPLLRLRVNAGEPAFFILDTGGGELILDPELAARVGAVSFGSVESTFAGDAKAKSVLGLVDRVELGEMVVENVPVRLLPTQRFSAAAWGRKVEGVLGTTLLRQFHFTLDYPGGRLLLRRSGSELGASADETVAEVPFRLVGDHLIVAQGCVEEAEGLQLLIDTGLAGGALAVPSSTLEEAEIDLEGLPSFTGQGGGGEVTVTPFVAERVCLGSLEAEGLTGFAGAFPESLEYRYGFRLGGLVSHGLLLPYAVTFDFAQMKVRLARPSAADGADGG